MRRGDAAFWEAQIARRKHKFTLEEIAEQVRYSARVDLALRERSSCESESSHVATDRT